jgi:hypothetical protein
VITDRCHPDRRFVLGAHDIGERHVVGHMVKPIGLPDHVD